MQAEQCAAPGYLGRADLCVMVEIPLRQHLEWETLRFRLLRFVLVARQFVGAFLPRHRKGNIRKRSKALRANRSTISKAKYPSGFARAPHDKVERAAVAMPADALR